MVGIYLNPGAGRFLTARSSKIYVDKTALLGELDAVFGTEQRFVCVSRPRRFGKTMVANMVCAYYDRTVADEVFDGLAIAQAEDFSRYRGACNVLRINMQEFLSEAQDIWMACSQSFARHCFGNSWKRMMRCAIGGKTICGW